MITYDTASNAFDDGVPPVTTLTWSHTCSVLPNRLLVVQVETDQTTSSVTYNGTALTQQTSWSAGIMNKSVWYLASPAAGAHNIVATIGAGGAIRGIGLSFYGANQSTVTGTIAGPSSAQTINITPTRTDSILIDNFTETGGTGTSLTTLNTSSTSLGGTYPMYSSRTAVTGLFAHPMGYTDGDTQKNIAAFEYLSAGATSVYTYPFAIPTGVIVFPQASGSQTLGSAALPLSTITSVNVSGSRQVARAWACWDQANGTPTISGSFNVASLTDGGAGLTTVIFTSALPNITYSCMGNSANANGQFQLLMPNILFTTGVKCTISNTATLNDNKINTLAVIGIP